MGILRTPPLFPLPKAAKARLSGEVDEAVALAVIPGAPRVEVGCHSLDENLGLNMSKVAFSGSVHGFLAGHFVILVILVALGWTYEASK